MWACPVIEYCEREYPGGFHKRAKHGEGTVPSSGLCGCSLIDVTKQHHTTEDCDRSLMLVHQSSDRGNVYADVVTLRYNNANSTYTRVGAVVRPDRHDLNRPAHTKQQPSIDLLKASCRMVELIPADISDVKLTKATVESSLTLKELSRIANDFLYAYGVISGPPIKSDNRVTSRVHHRLHNFLNDPSIPLVWDEVGPIVDTDELRSYITVPVQTTDNNGLFASPRDVLLELLSSSVYGGNVSLWEMFNFVNKFILPYNSYNVAGTLEFTRIRKVASVKVSLLEF